jgi:hypothetical protein
MAGSRTFFITGMEKYKTPNSNMQSEIMGFIFYQAS